MNNSARKGLTWTLLTLAVIVAAFLGLYLGSGFREKIAPEEVRWVQSQPTALLGVGDEFPDIPVMDADSSMTTTASLTDSGAVVIFMELGCPPCSVMSLQWQDVMEGWPTHPSVLGITLAAPDRITRYRDQMGLTFPIYSDTANLFETAFKITDFPYRVIVSRSGLIRHGTYDAREPIDTASVAALLRDDTTAAITSH